MFLNELHFICCATSVDILVISPVLWPYRRHPPRAVTCVMQTSPAANCRSSRQDAGLQLHGAAVSSKPHVVQGSVCGKCLCTIRLFISLHTAHVHWMQNSMQQFQCIYLDDSVTITSALRSPMRLMSPQIPRGSAVVLVLCKQLC